MSFLWLRGQTWFFRRAVPFRLRPTIGKKEVRISLKTGDAQLAKRRAIAEAAKVDRIFAEAEAALTNPQVAVYRALQDDAKERADRERQGHPRTEEDEEAFDSYITDKLEEDERAAEGEPGERRLDATQKAVLLGLLRRNANGAANEDNPPLSILFERYYKDRSLPGKTRLEWENARRRFTESIGGDVPVRAITKADVRRFKDSLVGSTSARTGKTITPATVRKQLGALGTVFAYAVRSGYVDVNPVHGVAQVLTKGKPEDRRLPLTLDDARAILDATKDEQAENLWIPRLALYTGARANELCGLLVRDVKPIDGVPCVVIEPSEVRSVKTASSTRRVPIHPELIRLGFLDFVEGQRAAGQTRLFPALTVGKYGSASAQYSKRFGRVLRSIGIADRRKVLHSARHTVKDQLRAAQVPVAVQNAILGHADGSVGESYGTGYPARVLLEAVSKIQYSQP